MAIVEEDEEAAAATATAPSDDDDDDDSDIGASDDDEDEGTGASDENKFEAYEGRIRRTASDRVKEYRVKMTASLNQRIQDYTAKVEEQVTTKLDEWTMRHAGAGKVANPERVAISLLRQNAAAEARHNAIREQLSQLEAAGIDISKLQAAMNAPAETAAATE